MPKTYICPFWKWGDNRCLHCEGGRVSFPDLKAKRDYVERYCASQGGWKACSIAGSLQDFYERKEREDGTA